jgi:hypothetical protein
MAERMDAITAIHNAFRRDMQGIGRKLLSLLLAGGIVLALLLTTPLAAGSAPAVQQKPTIRITKIPAYGDYSNLQGVVSGVDPAQYQVAVYIKVRQGWWTKPYWAHPATPIYPGGTWTCAVVTGGLDQYASDYAAFLIPKSMQPPLRHGEHSLPAALAKKAVAKTIVHRAGGK